MHRREVILGLVLVAAMVFLLWRWNSGSPEQASASRAARAAAAAPPGTDLPELALGRTSSMPEMDEEKLRNLFNYTKSPEEYQAERDEAERIRKLQEEARIRQEEEQKRRAAEAEAFRIAHANDPPPPPPKPQPPEVGYRFLGYFGPSSDKLAVLSDSRSGGDVQIVRKGETFDGKFKLLDIDFESVTIGYTDPQFAQEQRTIRMGG